MRHFRAVILAVLIGGFLAALTFLAGCDSG